MAQQPAQCRPVKSFVTVYTLAASNGSRDGKDFEPVDKGAVKGIHYDSPLSL